MTTLADLQQALHRLRLDYSQSAGGQRIKLEDTKNRRRPDHGSGRPIAAEAEIFVGQSGTGTGVFRQAVSFSPSSQFSQSSQFSPSS